MPEANSDTPMTTARFARLLLCVIVVTGGLAVLLLKLPGHQAAAKGAELAQTPAPAGAWRFVASGDSRNCGDVVMPAIAAQSAQYSPAFYWHLGDLRAIYNGDEDMTAEFAQRGQTLVCEDYRRMAWPDFIDHQLAPFNGNRIPVFVGIGNHETAAKPYTSEPFARQFHDWLASDPLNKQREADQDPHPHEPYTYYHWRERGVDFIYLDNSCGDLPDSKGNDCDFSADELTWFDKILEKAKQDPAVLSVVVGMHEALPDSMANDHSMCDKPGETPEEKKLYRQSCESGAHVYQKLLELQKSKPVYVLASHQHFYMHDAFGNHPADERLPGWIVGTAGAQRYVRRNAPPNEEEKKYGFLLGTVADDGKISFEFHEVSQEQVPAYASQRYAPDFVKWCFEHNVRNDPNTRPIASCPH